MPERRADHRVLLGKLLGLASDFAILPVAQQERGRDSGEGECLYPIARCHLCSPRSGANPISGAPILVRWLRTGKALVALPAATDHVLHKVGKGWCVEVLDHYPDLTELG